MPQYTRPYLDTTDGYRDKEKVLNEWENNHPLNQLKRHIRQVHSVLEHVDQLVSELEEERDRVIDDVIALHSENRKLREYYNETRNIYGRVAGKSNSSSSSKSNPTHNPKD